MITVWLGLVDVQTPVCVVADEEEDEEAAVGEEAVDEEGVVEVVDVVIVEVADMDDEVTGALDGKELLVLVLVVTDTLDDVGVALELEVGETDVVGVITGFEPSAAKPTVLL